MEHTAMTNTADDLRDTTVPLVYIVGNSHCGSTLFGLLLSAHPEMINLGELKIRTWLKERQCSCGELVQSCAFYKDYFSFFNEVKKAGISRLRTIPPIRFFFQKTISTTPEEKAALQSLYASMSKRVRECYPDARYMIDCSKSLWMLNAWLKVLPRDQVKILWLKRNTSANVSSFLKRGVPFMTSLMSILVNTYLTGKFLRRNKLEFVEVDYDRFYAHYAEQAKIVGDFIGLTLPSGYHDHGNHHVISGNHGTRRDFRTSFNGIRPDDEWKNILKPWQKKLISWVS